MSYWERNTSRSSPSLDSVSATKSSAGGGSNITDAFYEIEPAVVLDIIIDDKHPYFKNEYIREQWPISVYDKKPDKGDKDYSWVGRVLVRLLYTQRELEKEDLVWAMPLESNISEFPVINEIVGVIHHMGQYFYTKKLNMFNTLNANADFNIELSYGGYRTGPESEVKGNRELDTSATPYAGPESKLNEKGDTGYIGVLGRYFKYNQRIRTIRRREGDLIIEGRFGHSIRFGTYDDNRGNDSASPDKDYQDKGGNPFILIRNRQRPLKKIGESQQCYENPDIPPVIGTITEKNVGGYFDKYGGEDVNNDGTSIHITSGATLSDFHTNCFKVMWGDKPEEQVKFNGATKFKFPKLMNDQIVINSERVILSAKKYEMFAYSKKRMAFVTDDEYTVDSHNQMVLTTNTKIVLNSPAIYLGEYNKTDEPVLLGQTTTNWLYDLCEWLKTHTHWHKHNHPDGDPSEGMTGQPDQASPNQTQIPVQIVSLILLQNRLDLNMSRRVFVTGGGLAPGQDGGNITNGSPPVKISIPSGAGCPGGFKGLDYRQSAAAAAAAFNSALNKADSITDDSTKSDTQKVAELKALPAADKATAAKGGGCGGRKASRTGIFSSQSYAPETAEESASRQADLVKWDYRNSLLKKAGIIESDGAPPPNVDVNDWTQTVVGTFK